MSVVMTTRGPVEGLDEAGLLVFRGIPYAQPPVGPLRFCAPEPRAAWSAVRDCRRFQAGAPQVPSTLRIASILAGSGSAGENEDCLYLNLWTPGLDNQRRPVLVWIHGGGFVLGASSALMYHGRRLARRGDVVVVSLNYRLGALGFLALDEFAAPGEANDNLGIRDQIAALEWVRDNIDAFGGDPENVTVFGESAGGMSVGTLLGVPAARGLFRRGILQSGAASNTSSPTRAQEVARHFVSHLKRAPRSLAELHALSVQEILQAQRMTSLELSLRQAALPWQPRRNTGLLPHRPLDAIAVGAARGVDLLIGTNRDEWNIFMLADPKGRRLDAAGLDRRLHRYESMAQAHDDEEGLAAVERARTYRAAAHDVSPTSHWIRFQAERMFHLPATRLADTHATQSGRCFVYRFDYAHPLVGRWLGACHGFEVPFVFGSLREPPLAALFAATPAARALSRRMMRAWVAFARSGDPAHDDLPPWPRYDPSNPAMLVFDQPCRVSFSRLAE